MFYINLIDSVTGMLILRDYLGGINMFVWHIKNDACEVQCDGIQT